MTFYLWLLIVCFVMGLCFYTSVFCFVAWVDGGFSNIILLVGSIASFLLIWLFLICLVNGVYYEQIYVLGDPCLCCDCGSLGILRYCRFSDLVGITWRGLSY
ncbi:hypothetical protein HFGIMCCB_00105 [Enterobacteria phage Whisky]|nr:hypothetical protein HFGIMCCB_00105 [Enterobacteria phage Whisky]